MDRSSRPRRVALAALTVACVVTGPVPQLVEAMERIYAVAMAEAPAPARHRSRRRRTGPRGPRNRRPAPVRP